MSVEMLTLKVISPISLHQRRSSEQFAATLDFIPGSTLRGAFAELYLASNPARAQEPDFQRIFLSDEVAFSDFLPSPGTGSDLPCLFPLSALACKRFEDHFLASLTDNLLRMELLRQAEAARSVLDQDWRVCPICAARGLDGKRERVEAGYYASIDRLDRIKLHRRMVTGTAIRRSTQTAAHGMLFSHEVIEESSAYPDGGVYFRGAIHVPDDLRQSLLNMAPIGRELAVGYGRSRGWGLVEVEQWSTPRTPAETLQERWQTLNEKAGQFWSAYGIEPTSQYFSLTLTSHLLLRDHFGQPILGGLQPAQLGFPENVQRCRFVTRPYLVQGWNAVMGRPKSDRWALCRGSVLLFSIPAEVDATPVMARLDELQQSGVGDRLSEGFGRMVACDPFHYHFISQELKGAVQ